MENPSPNLMEVRGISNKEDSLSIKLTDEEYVDNDNMKSIMMTNDLSEYYLDFEEVRITENRINTSTSIISYTSNRSRSTSTKSHFYDL